MNQKTKQIVWFLVGTIIAVSLDQWTKLLAVKNLKGQEPFVVLDGIFEFLYSENRGAAFGMLQGKQGFFFLVTMIVIMIVGYTLYRMPVHKRYYPLELCLLFITSGAIGNMIDRITQGYVVDFLYFSLIDFPIFNIADCYVTISTLMLVILMLFYYKEEELEFFSKKKKGDPH